MISVAAMLLALLQPVNEVEEDTPFSDRQPVRLAPLPMAQALGAFHDTCMATFPDAAAFDTAVAATGLGFVRRDEPQRGASEWSSQHGHIELRQAQRRSSDERRERRERREGRQPRQRWQERCDFWVAVEERRDVPDLLMAIGQQLAPGRPPVEEIIGASWDLGPSPAGGRLKLVYLPAHEEDPRLFTLSLQRLPDNPPL